MLLSCLFAFLGACSLLPAAENRSTPQATAVSTPATINTPLPQATTNLSNSTSITPTQQTLRVWIPPELATANGDNSPSTLETQINTFATSRTDLNVQIEYKAVGGQGGILSYLRTGRVVAPSILPDIVALPVEQLGPALTDQLIYPLDAYLPETFDALLFPASQTQARFNNQIAGYPFAITHLTHLAYNTAVVDQTIPLDWDALIELEDNRLGLPTAGRDGDRLLLQLYLAAGGTLTNEAGQPSLDVLPLAFALESIRNGLDTGFVDPTLAQASTFVEMWNAYDNDRATIILTTASDMLRRLPTTPNQTAVFQVSGFNDPLVPLVSGWAWALTTPDPSEQTAAIDLITYLTGPENVAAWSAQTNVLPARTDIIAQWDIDPTYLSFLEQELNRANAYPDAATTAVQTVLRQALTTVVSGQSSPQQAAETAVSSLQE